MRNIGILKNCIQTYAWGSKTAIPQLLGEDNPSGMPQAEIWMGAHPKAPSMVFYENQWVSLDFLIHENPEQLLGRKACQKFNNTLPFLFKVLAAEKPLSIQAHPDHCLAKQGFQRENLLQIPLDAFNRNYKDENHKPECICALTPFWALLGFRRIRDIRWNMDMIFPDDLAAEKNLLFLENKREGLKAFFGALIEMPPAKKETLIHKTLRRLKTARDRGPAMIQWIIRLYDEYPTDMGIFSPAYLNLVRLQPGQALFLPSGELHAYLEGIGIEVMANSDNVLRGGLTVKHVDVAELRKVLNFEERQVSSLSGEPVSATQRIYRTPAEEFQLSAITVKPGKKYICSENQSLEILLWTEGESTLYNSTGGDRLDVVKGTSLVIPASVKHYEIIGNAQIYKVGIP